MLNLKQEKAQSNSGLIRGLRAFALNMSTSSRHIQLMANRESHGRHQIEYLGNALLLSASLRV